jgi:hypothetical protein
MINPNSPKGHDIQMFIDGKLAGNLDTIDATAIYPQKLSLPVNKYGANSQEQVMRSEIKDYEQTLIRERAEKKKLRETVDRYKKALEFYADPAVYKLSAEADKADLTEFINMLDMDNGDIARKALKGDEHD